MITFHLFNQKVCTRLYLFGHDLESLLTRNGWQQSDPKTADYIFINTCSFLKTTEDYFINKIMELDSNKSAKQKLVVFGCLPHTANERLRDCFKGEIIKVREISALASRLGLTSNNQEIGYLLPRQLRLTDKLTGIVNRLLIHNPYLGFLSGAPAYYLNISRGCLGNCTYCSEKSARGSLVSHSICNIIKTFQQALSEGHRLFSLNADDVGVFGWDNNENIADLLAQMLAQKDNFKLILTEFNPWGLIKHQTKLLPLLASPKIAHITIPIQSGSNKILKSMKRPYSARTAMELVKIIRNSNPNIVINTHLIVGFPGETTADYNLTLELIKTRLFDKVKIFKYSDHKKVESYLLSQKISAQIIDDRYKQLRRAVILEAIKKLSLRNLLLNLPLYFK